MEKLKIDDFLLVEKIGLLSQNLYGWECFFRQNGSFHLTEKFKREVKKYGTLGFIYGLSRSDPWTKMNFGEGLTFGETAIVKKLIDDYIFENTRLKIPVSYVEEAPHGHLALESTLLPTNISLGATWNPDLVYKSFELVAMEMKKRGVDVALLSLLDVLRDPHWGRSEECYSEDPVLSRDMAMAALSGASEHIGVVMKHYAAQGSNVAGRNAAGAIIGDRELHEIHLLAAKELVSSGKAIGIMAAYNHIDGIHCHANPYLLKTLLREKWGFEGFVMSDGCGIDTLLNQTKSDVDAISLAVNSGVEVDLWNKTFNSLEQAVIMGKVKIQTIDQAVERVLRMKNSLHGKDFFPKKIGKEIQEKLAEESSVLLKNDDNILPISKDVSIALIGPHISNVYTMLGDYTPFQKSEFENSFSDVFTKEFSKISTAEGSQVVLPSESLNNAIEIAKNSEIVILTLGTSSSRESDAEFMNNGAVKGDSKLSNMNSGENVDSAVLTLPRAQRELFEKVWGVNKNIIVVLINGRPLDIDEIIEKSRAVIVAGYPGVFGPKALLNNLLGKVDFTGRLPYSMIPKNGVTPNWYNYRSYNKHFDADDFKMYKFQFGFGLSYAKVAYEHVEIDKHKLNKSEVEHEKDFCTLSILLKNNSGMSTKEVIQVYKKAITNTSVVPRQKELIAFSKIELAEFEKKEVKMRIGMKNLSTYIGSGEWGVQPQELILTVGDFSFSVEVFENEKGGLSG